MKKHSLAEFMKSKSFYALLCVGVLAILAITLVSLNQPSNKEEGNNLADLNEPIVDEVTDGDQDSYADELLDTNNNPLDTAANIPSTDSNVASNDPTQNEIKEPVTDGSLLDSDAEDDPNAVANAAEDIPDTASADDTTNSDAEVATQENQTQEVISPETLYFDTEKGLLWPVKGEVLMDYSADKVVFFKTLEQFKCNPAMIIGAQVGTDVLSAADGIITSITTEAETGTTVTINVGSGYSLVYGQLDKKVNYKVGELVKEGSVIGTITKPTMFYYEEGSNLYFQVSKDEDTLNPMELLRK
ncbi:MAG: peptidoglycan DD-metalloendopeptidase family protein [Anaerocolumna sp.]